MSVMPSENRQLVKKKADQKQHIEKVHHARCISHLNSLSFSCENHKIHYRIFLVGKAMQDLW